MSNTVPVMADPDPSTPTAPTSATQAMLRRLRQRYGQTELARLTGIPQPRLSRWEAGDVPVGADDALKLREFEQALGAASTESAAPAQKAG
jgi:transcriptional regulator with XRE-family HTH domain